MPGLGAPIRSGVGWSSTYPCAAIRRCTPPQQPRLLDEPGPSPGPTVGLPPGTTRTDVASLSVPRVPILAANDATVPVSAMNRRLFLHREYLPGRLPALERPGARSSPRRIRPLTSARPADRPVPQAEVVTSASPGQTRVLGARRG
jgi:hypothetical protein